MKCIHDVRLTSPCDACFHAHVTRGAPVRLVPPDPGELTLHEAAALQLAALAALDNVPASLSASTQRDLRAGLEKVNRAVIVLAGPSGAATARPRTKPKSKQVATAKQRHKKRDDGKHHRR